MKYLGCEGTWTDERVELLKTMWIEGKSAAEIAKVLKGVTRNAVIGKVHRAGLCNRPAAAALTKGVKKPKHEKRVNIKSVFTPPSFAKVRTKLQCVEVVSEPVSFIDRTSDQCGFILDGHDEPTCCGAPVKLTSTGRRLSNCPAHESLTHAEVQPRPLNVRYFAGLGRAASVGGIARRNALPNDMREAA